MLALDCIKKALQLLPPILYIYLGVLYKEREKQELQDLVDKRRHENFVKTGNVDLQFPQQV